MFQLGIAAELVHLSKVIMMGSTLQVRIHNSLTNYFLTRNDPEYGTSWLPFTVWKVPLDTKEQHTPWIDANFDFYR